MPLSSLILHNSSFEIWSSAIKARSSAGRGGGKKQEFYGIKKLRELILELAVRGLLVPQDPKDEPAGELLKKIAKEKAQLVKDGKMKKGRKFSLSKEEMPFEIPQNWSWTQLGEISEIGPRATLEDDLDVGFVPMPLISTSYKGEHGQEIKKWGAVKKGYTHFSNGDIAIAKITPCFENSKAAIFGNLSNGHGAGTTELHVARPIGKFVNPRFILLYLKAPMFLEKGKPQMTGSAGQKRVPATFFIGNPLPLPPLAEQHRIVAKVDELMGLCDRLEKEQADSLCTHETLVATLLDALTTSEPRQFTQAWQRIATHFDSLFTTEKSIDQLKQTILQLAVMGKLVEQEVDSPPMVSLGEILSEPSFNGVSKGPTMDTTATEVLRISAGTSRDDFYVDEFDFKHVDIAPEDIEKATLRAGDLLACRYNGNLHYVGKFSLYRAESGRIQVNPDKLIRFRVDTTKHSPRYVCFTMNAASTREAIEAMCATTAGNIGLSAGKIKTVPIPLRSLAEQHRIVAKVDKLMALCDRLKANLQAAQTTQLNLADGFVETAIY